MKQESQGRYERLQNTLQSLVKRYRALLSIVRKEREILLSADLDSLNENNRVKEEMLVHISQLEKLRIEQTKELCESEGLNSESPKLLTMATDIGGAEGEQLQSLHSVLELLLKRVKEVNAKNEVLIESALSNITGAMNSIKDGLDQNKTYKSAGKVEKSPAASGQLVSKQV